MNIGELFFSLGFKSTGLGEAKNFENTLSGAKEASDYLAASMDALGEILGSIALKMGAITKAELAEINVTKKLEKSTNDLNKAKKSGLESSKNNLGIMQTLNSKMKEYWGTLSTIRLQILGATGALTYFVKKAGDAAIHLDKMSSLTGVSTTQLQRLGDLAAQTGASVDDITSAVQHFQRESVNIMLGRGGNIGVYQFLGLNPHEDPLKLLDQLSRKLKTMPTALGTTMARDLGLSDDLIYFLKNAENLKPASDETLLTDKEIRRLKEFNFYFTRVFEQSKRVLQKFAAFLTPIASQVVYFFDRLGSMFTGVANHMEPFFKKLKQYMPWIVTLGGVLFAAFFPLTATLVGISLVLEDLWSFVKGDDSLFGRMFNWLTDINGMIKDAIHYYIQLRKVLTLGQHDEYWDKREKELFEGAKEFLDKFKTENKETKTGKGAGIVSKMMDYQKGEMNFDLKSGLENLVKSMDNALGYNPKTGSYGDSTTNNNNTITINVNESKTPKETATAIKEEIGNAYWQRKGGAR